LFRVQQHRALGRWITHGTKTFSILLFGLNLQKERFFLGFGWNGDLN
jgi:hypothetical protein